MGLHHIFFYSPIKILHCNKNKKYTKRLCELFKAKLNYADTVI